ncbi:unnamed protein product [Macrosiphum euphorbiae]|uniref:Uncharacterized protein n=1 Tax=Macrosiphum euphorbiae TaxID=13131 RepID=A0AAV0YDP9_9HEMI|nr:unnamed protein product [Macrosiphum euphorbiae]
MDFCILVVQGLEKIYIEKLKASLKNYGTVPNAKILKILSTPKLALSRILGTIESLVESIEFMSGQFESFKNQMKDILSTLGELQTENKIVKAQM